MPLGRLMNLTKELGIDEETLMVRGTPSFNTLYQGVIPLLPSGKGSNSDYNDHKHLSTCILHCVGTRQCGAV